SGAGPYDADEPLAEPVTFRLPGAPAGKPLVNKIFKKTPRKPAGGAPRRGSENLPEITYLPPFSANAREVSKRPEPSFNVLENMKEDKLEEYRAKFPVRVAVTEAIKALNDNAKFTMRESLINPGGPITPKIKSDFLKDQEDPGIATFYLKGALDRLKA